MSLYGDDRDREVIEQERIERDAQRDRDWERERSRVERHTPAPDFHQHIGDGCRAFPCPPPGFELRWAYGGEPRLERINEREGVDVGR